MGNTQSNSTLPIHGTSMWVEFEDDWFAQGASRRAYRGTYHEDIEYEGKRCVVKVFKEQTPENFWETAYETHTQASMKANQMAQIFNQKHPICGTIEFVVPAISRIESYATKRRLLIFERPKKVKGRLPETKALTSEMIPKGTTVAIERYLGDKFVKFLSNSSYVNHNVNASLPSTFSHFTYNESRGQILVCGLQGVRLQRDQSYMYVFTNPAIHSSNQGVGYYGPTDLGVFGILKFFQNHECNQHCRGFITPDSLSISRNEENKVNSILQAIRMKASSTFTNELAKTISMTHVHDIQRTILSSLTNGASNKGNWGQPNNTGVPGSTDASTTTTANQTIIDNTTNTKSCVFGVKINKAKGLKVPQIKAKRWVDYF